MWWTPHPARPGTAEFGFHGLTTMVANCFLITGLAFLAYMTIVRLALRAGNRSRVARHRSSGRAGCARPLLARSFSNQSYSPADDGAAWQLQPYAAAAQQEADPGRH